MSIIHLHNKSFEPYLPEALIQEKVKELGEGVPAKLPMWNSNEQVRKMYHHLWDPPELNPRVMRLIAISERPSVLKPENFQAKREAAGWRFTFDLPSGAYATVVLSQLFKLEEKHSRPAKAEVVAKVEDAANEDDWQIWSPAAVRDRAQFHQRLNKILGLLASPADPR